jgi:3-oxoacyl-[acyl-carrier protein] reductase
VLINNPGITVNIPLEQVTVEQFETLCNVNIRGMFFVTPAALPAMIAQGQGVVINLAWVRAFAGMSEHTVYAGTKGAIVAFLRLLALEMAPKGILVNAIAPANQRLRHMAPKRDSQLHTAQCRRAGLPAGSAVSPRSSIPPAPPDRPRTRTSAPC